MDEKLITISKADYEVAKDSVIQEMLGDEKLKGETKLLIPLIGSIFVEKMKARLFGDKEEK